MNARVTADSSSSLPLSSPSQTFAIPIVPSFCYSSSFARLVWHSQTSFFYKGAILSNLLTAPLGRAFIQAPLRPPTLGRSSTPTGCFTSSSSLSATISLQLALSSHLLLDPSSSFPPRTIIGESLAYTTPLLLCWLHLSSFSTCSSDTREVQHVSQVSLSIPIRASNVERRSPFESSVNR